MSHHYFHDFQNDLGSYKLYALLPLSLATHYLRECIWFDNCHSHQVGINQQPLTMGNGSRNILLFHNLIPSVPIETTTAWYSLAHSCILIVSYDTTWMREGDLKVLPIQLMWMASCDTTGILNKPHDLELKLPPWQVGILLEPTGSHTCWKSPRCVLMMFSFCDFEPSSVFTLGAWKI